MQRRELVNASTDHDCCWTWLYYIRLGITIAIASIHYGSYSLH